jgi:hypothetical protein
MERITLQDIRPLEEIKMPSFMVEHEQRADGINVKHILSRHKAERKNHLIRMSAYLAFTGFILSILSMETSIIGGSVACIPFAAYLAAFLYANPEVV